MSVTAGTSKAVTLVELAEHKLRSDILTGKFAPGAKLRIDELRTAYSIGASPLREALSRLISNGLVTTQGQKGFRVATVSKADIRDITDTRKVLERAALAKSFARGDAEWEAQVVTTYEWLEREHEILRSTDGDSADAWEEANNAFHDAMVAACDSKWLLNFRQIVYDQALRYRRMVVLDEELERGAYEEHRQMFAAALERDIERVGQLADDHAERTYNLMMERFAD